MLHFYRRMKPSSNSKSKARRKLKNFEWTDEAIQNVADAEMVISAPEVENMDTKIARVQNRKKEAQEREKRKAMRLPPASNVESDLRHLNLSDDSITPSKVLADALNAHFQQVLEQAPHLSTNFLSVYPPYLFDSSIFSELLVVPALPAEAACLVPSTGPEDSPRGKALGYWQQCQVLSEIRPGVFEVHMLSSRGVDLTFNTPTMNVCFITYNTDTYAERVKDALMRRRTCVQILKYYNYIASMPYEQSVISSLSHTQRLSISQRVKSFKRIKGNLIPDINPDDPSGVSKLRNEVLDRLFAETKEGFELVMKKIVFDANMLSASNKALRDVLSLPPTFFAQPTVPHCAVLSIPRHNMKANIAMLDPNSFLSASHALQAIQGVMEETFLTSTHTIQEFTYDKSFTLTKFERAMAELQMKSVRIVKQDWTQETAALIRVALGGSKVPGETPSHPPEGTDTSHPHFYDIYIRNSHDYEASTNPIKRLLERSNFMMSNCLYHLMRDSLEKFTARVVSLCAPAVVVKAVDEIIVHHKVVGPDGKLQSSIYKTNRYPPLFQCTLNISNEPCVINKDQVKAAEDAIAKWKALPESKDSGAKCPITPVQPIMGKVIAYNNEPEAFKEVVLNVFDAIIDEFQDVPHIQKHVMEKIFFPSPKVISTFTAEAKWVGVLRTQLDAAMESCLNNLRKYHSLFKKYEGIVNIDPVKYVESKITVQRSDPDNQEIELPVSVNVAQISSLVQEHLDAIAHIEEHFPTHVLDCGLFGIDISSLRSNLLELHGNIVKLVMRNHAGHCMEVSQYLDDEFRKVIKNLSKRPDDIEQLTELQEIVNGVQNHLAPLEHGIKDMLSYYNLLEKFGYKVDIDQSNFKWNVYRLPTKVHQKCDEVANNNVAIKRRFHDEMLDHQSEFVKSLFELEKDVVSLENYVDVSDVDFVFDRIKNIEQRLEQATEKARLFNSREGLFDTDITDYEDLSRVAKLFEPYAFLWNTTKEWADSHTKWTTGKFIDLDADSVEQDVDKFNTAISKAYKFFSKQPDMERQAEIASTIRTQITEFLPEVPCIVTLRNPGMRDRHWESIAHALNIDIMPIERFTTEEVLAMNIKDSLELIQKIGESAAKEFQIEQALDKMEREWEGRNLEIHPYRETGTGVLKGIDDINVILDEQITMAQTIMFSAFKGPFEERIDEWNRKLCAVSDVLEVWVAVQRNWLYLQPIFESADINRQLPTEGKKFATVDKNWRGTISSAKVNPKVLEFCDNEKLLERFKESEVLLDQVQKGLSDYLETKRSVFARFYFLSNDELLSILSESKDVHRVQPHLKKCFEGIDKVKFRQDLTIDRFISPESEEVMCLVPIDPKEKGVEHWMLELEEMMRLSVRDVMRQAVEDYVVTPRPTWMQKWPGMCVLNGSQMHWTREMEDLFVKEKSQGPRTFLDQQVKQLADMTVLVRGKLDKLARVTVGALTVIDVHARDVIIKLVDDDVDTKDNFGWTSQLRYYWDGADLTTQMVAANRPYGYEYLGNTFRLVITPLTDKCYLTLMGALQMIFGGAPAGPAGTGKTETTKDLAKALAMQCVVFNCSDGLDYIAMGKFFKGLAACGAWACFDEFNRINIEVLSVIGQQIMSIQMAIRAKEPRILFEGSDIALNPGFAVFITMNPGYAGRSALPDSLQALFRPVAMMVPDYALIGEIMFFAYGFEYAKECGAKMVTTFKLCSEQLSAQPHYDYGMRAVKTVITAAGNLKRAEPNADEMVLLLRALQDVNIPKFLEMDLPLFGGIISDLFPGRQRPVLDYGDLMATMKVQIHKFGLQPLPFFIAKVIQLYEMIVVRHGLMLVGPTGGGKSKNLHILEETLGSLKDQGKTGFAYEHVKIFQLNPKSITMGQMYGEFDPNTLEWRDGIMSTMYRNATVDTPDRKWMLFDGPVDAIWIENMNTVLDDNKKLCLNSGEIIKMSNEMTMMFEVEDLAVASPATVSRVGIIYMEPGGLGLDVLVQSWLDALPACIPQLVKSKLTYLFDAYMQPSISFLRTYLKELAPSIDNNLAESLMRVLDCFFVPFVPAENVPAPTDIMLADLCTCIDAHFIFALVWSICITVNDDGRKMFDAFIRNECAANKIPYPFPKEGSIYDYLFSLSDKKWIKWMTIIDPYEIDPKMSFSEIIIPTTDSVRNTYILDMLLSNNKHVLMVGDTGTGKTININQYLMGSTKVDGKVVSPNVMPINMTFSANTSANLTQDTLDSKMDKRRKGVYGPAAGKQFYVYVDDLNMPKREEYGAQPPIELLRQWFDQGGWYDRKDLTFRRIIDLTFVASMGPPGGGRQDVTARFIRHFNMIGYVEMSDNSKAHIFGTILRNYLGRFEGDLVRLTDSIVESSIDVFSTIVKELLPTPSKSHYTFNLRDLAKIFQGMLMVTDPKQLASPVQLGRLWVHEGYRVFGDRLTCDEDREWLTNKMKSKIEDVFKMSWGEVFPRERLVYGDFMNFGSEVRNYEEIDSIDELKKTIEEYLVEHNSESKQPMPLVLFKDALEHVARIARVLRQPQGNCLLLGVGGSGRQSMTKLATYVSGFSLFQVEIVKGYSMNDWREDLKKCLMQAGVKGKMTTFLFSDVQIINERMVEDINNILNAGDVPNLYAPEDLEAISTACRVECQKRKIPPTKLNIFAQYINRVRKNIHLCVCMSPLGEPFRNRLRNFPALVNCCTIDWFTNWPAEALQSVGLSILQTANLGLNEFEEPAVEVFKNIHMSVEQKSVEYYEMLRRRNYVTPTSYLELLSSFGKLLGTKKAEINTKKDRLQIGLDKLSETKTMVGVMQEELTILQPQIVKTQAEVAEMMVEITKDKAAAAETKATVELEEASANEKAAAAKAIADDAQRDLDEAIPALEEAVKCLNDLKKSDIDEVKSLRTPPSGVVLTIKVCCLMFEVKPTKINDPNNPGKKIDDYWEAGKKNLLTDAKAFVSSLFDFDKDNIPDRVIKNIAPFMDDPSFTPQAIEKASKACTAICMWARAMYKYHFVALGVAPKRAALKAAEEELAVVMAALAKSQAQLKAVNDRLQELEKAFNEAVEKKDMLEKKEATCKVQLSNADKLIGGLGGEETRWRETVETLKEAAVNVLGDVVVSAGTISYLGVFTSEFRNSLVGEWQRALTQYNIPHTKGCNVESTLANPVKVRSWQLFSLPSDSLSTQNGIIMDNARRWPLLIDPQGQANRFIRNMAKDKEFAENGMDVVKLTDKNFLRTLENGVQFGRWVLLENILESLDAALEPILLQQKFKQGGQEMMKIGDNVIPYNDTFRFFMTTKLSNPHYAPEVQVKVSLLNFTITLGGLEEQLLNVVVENELPELSAQKANLVVQNALMNKQLYDIESEILRLLSNSTGNILDDTVLIETLAQSKLTSEEIKTKMKEASVIEAEIVVQSELYRPVAKRSSLLYFVIADLGDVDPMYQYSLPWFTMLFVRGISNAVPANDIESRITNLNDYFTYSVYQNICRSLFERHKLLFSFILCIKILQGENVINAEEYRFLLSGIAPTRIDCPLPESNWLEPNVWSDICEMGGLPVFNELPTLFAKHIKEWQAVFDSPDPHEMNFPPPCENLTELQRLCILRCLRRDKVEVGMQRLIIHYLDRKFIDPPPFDLRVCYNESVPITPLIFVLSSGSDPNKELDLLAEDMNMTDRLRRIALGQGQGKKASTLIEKGILNGDWVMLQNCHLSISWMPVLEQICENFEPDRIHPEFRLWLTSMPSEHFPSAVLQNGVKITKEPPKGIRANLKNTYLKLSNEDLKKTDKQTAFQKLLFGLSFYHALVVERKKFGPLGWNIPYEFNDTDMDISAAQLELYVSSYSEIPYKVLQQLTSVVNYGGRITDDKDMRTSDIIVADFFCPKILDSDYKFSRSGIFYSFMPDPDAPHASYVEYIDTLPQYAEPEAFGMHDNANITCAITEADSAFSIILTLQPRVASGGTVSREDLIIDMARATKTSLPDMFDVEAVGMLYPTDYHESMNTVLVQEAQRYNLLLRGMHSSLRELQKALKGLVVLSAELEKMGNDMFDQRVPAGWTARAYPSLKPLGPWTKDLLLRLKFLQTWIDQGTPSSFWISGFFFPQGFLTAILQNYARKHQMPIDTVSFSFVLQDVMEGGDDSKRPKPEDGCFIYGLFLEGARWSFDDLSLVDPKPKELFSPMPAIHMLPEQNREAPSGGIYRCPVYKVLTRTGTLSTTGHSTNFVTWIEIPSDKDTVWRSSLVSETNAQIKFCDQDYWIKAGVACFCALRY